MTATSPDDHCWGSVMSILMAPERTSLRTVLKRVGLSRLGVTEASSFDVREASVGIGSAGTVGGVGICIIGAEPAELDQAHMLEAH